jgi:hypothetical protein
MSDKHEKQVRKFQETQQALRETIEQAKELAEKTQQLLHRRDNRSERQSR